jgi:hypothetical protein
MPDRKIFLAFFFSLALTVAFSQETRWTTQQANAWYAKQGWLRGCNFQPSTAINQLEMFQKETFDTATINRELGWAEQLGMNVMRVYLHHLLWTADNDGFKKRLNEYLGISTKHHIKTLFVLFDDCWNDTAWVGKQPAPKPGVHNSGWVRDPGSMILTHPDTLTVLQAYVTDIIGSFRNDERILLWDLYNEPGNSKSFEKSLPLLEKVFQWARAAKPSQPVSAGLWADGPGFWALNKFQIEHSDVITYHNYNIIDDHIHAIDTLRRYGRPLICTEYMARRNASLFQVIMPMLKQENIAAINWGFVSGKTNTIYAWDTPMPDGKEPQLWFHDIFRKDDTPFSKEEVKFIKRMTGR